MVTSKSNEQTITNTLSHYTDEKAYSRNRTSDLPLDYTTYLIVEKTPNNIDISNKNNEQFTQDDNYADLSDSRTSFL